MIGAMAFNPYEPPRADDVWRPPTSGVMAGRPLPWTIEEALAVGWDRVKRWWPVLVLGWAGMSIVSSILTEVMSAMNLELLGNLLSLGFTAFMSVGMTRAVLSAVRGQEPGFDQLLGGADRMLPMLGSLLLFVLAMMAGLALFVIPGIVVCCGLALTYFTSADEQHGPLAALQRSWSLTEGHKLQLFGFGLVSLVVMLAGILALGIGFFVAVPVLYVAAGWIYTRLRGELVTDRLG